MVNCFDLLSGIDVNTLWTRSGICGKNRKESRTLIDGIFVSQSLTNKVSNVRINHCADNLSDHSPVEIDLNLALSVCEVAKQKSFSFVSWEKLDISTLDTYRHNLTDALSTIEIDSTLIHHDYCICDNDVHKYELERYLDSIVYAMACADRNLPRTTSGTQKSFWNDGLSSLKNKCVDAYHVWRDAGQPNDGAIFDLKISARSNYKKALKSAQGKEKSIVDDVNINLQTRNQTKFWKSWSRLNNSKDSYATRIKGFINDSEIADCFADYFEKVYCDVDTDADTRLKCRFNDKFPLYFDRHKGDSISPYLFSC